LKTPRSPHESFYNYSDTTRPLKIASEKIKEVQAEIRYQNHSPSRPSKDFNVALANTSIKNDNII
jgi:hypothetical protein